MPRPALWFALTLAVLLAAGCGEVPAAGPAGPGPATPPTLEPYPVLPTQPPRTVPTETPMPTRTRVPPIPTPTSIQPTPYAPAEALPTGFPTVVYAVQRPGQPVQLWRLRHEGGMLREELWVDLTPAVLEARVGPGFRSIGYMGVDRLVPSPDGCYIALVLGPVSGRGSQTLIIDHDQRMCLLTLEASGQVQGVGLLAWLPDSDRLFAGNDVGFVWGTIRRDGTDFVEFPGQSVFVEFPGRFVLPAVLDAVALADDEMVLFSHLPIGDIWMGSIEITSAKLTPFSLPEHLLASLKGKGHIRNLALSPDGSTCAFTAEHSVTDQGGGQIWLVGADGADFRPLGPDDTFDYALAWSPDGRAIAFSRWDQYPAIQAPSAEPAVPITSLWLIDPETGQERMLLSSEGQYAHWSPRWLPDGSGLVFISDRGGETNLWFICPDGRGLQQLTWQGGLSGEVAVLKR